MTRTPRQHGVQRPTVDAGRLWAGGLAAAVIAGLIADVGILIARGIFDVAVLAPQRDGAWGDADTARYALAAAAAALLATGLIHLLILFVPRYATFFTWIIGLVTAVAVLAPFALDVETSAKVATALINLILGIAIGSLVAGVARTAIQLPRSDTWPGAQPPYQR